MTIPIQLSKIGFGSYRIDDRLPEHAQALRQALLSGCNVIDTSSNYTDGASETLIGSVVSDLVRNETLKVKLKERLTREELFIVTKAGYVQGSNMELARLRIEQRKPFSEMVAFSPDCWHCISPDFLATQIERSLSRLGDTSLDALLLHNPEYFLKTNGDHAEYYRRIRQAFEYLEAQVASRRIRRYGVSSNTFGFPKESPEYTSLEVLLDLAREVSSTHHFELIELPLNLFEPGAALEANNSGKTVLELALENGITVLTNRPLNAFSEGNLIRLADFPAPQGNQPEDLQAALQEALSHLIELESNCPEQALAAGRTLAWGHAIQKNFSAIASPDSWGQILQGRIRPALEASLGVLAGNQETLPWAEEYRFRSDELFELITAYVGKQAHEQSRAISSRLDSLCPELKTSSSLVQKVLRIYLSLPGVSCVLLGMRRPRYVEDVRDLIAGNTEPLAPDVALSLLGSGLNPP